MTYWALSRPLLIATGWAPSNSMALLPLVRISRANIADVVVPSPAKMFVAPVDRLSNLAPISCSLFPR